MKPGAEQPPSSISLITALARGLHRSRHARPWILDDPFALPLIGLGWPELYERIDAAFRDPLKDEGIGFATARSRYAEDRLTCCGCDQYVVLGAGLDSFAWRRPDLLGRFRVIEIDHPATQAWKRRRALELALPASPNHILASAEFESETLCEGLEAAGFDGSRPALLSWLGVVPYLTSDAVEATLRTIAGCCAPGTELVLTYLVTDEHLDQHGREFLEIFGSLAAQSGEPLELRLPPIEAEALVRRCGLEVAEHLTPDQLWARFFATRSDSLRPYTVERVLCARVTGNNDSEEGSRQ